MTKVNEQIIDLMKVIYDTSKLNPKSKPFFLSQKKLKDFPDAKAILEKLEKEYKVIDIVQLPNRDRVSPADLDLIEIELGEDALDEMLSYQIKILPNFDDFYHKEYAHNKVSVANLTTRNYFLILDLATELNHELNLSLDDEVIIKSSHHGDYLWDSIGRNRSINNAKIARLNEQSVKFLSHIGAIKDYEILNREVEDLYGNFLEESDVIQITINRPIFDETYKELLALYDKHKGINPENKVKSKTKLQTKEFNNDKTILYEVTYKDRVIRINGISLSKHHFSTENEVFFDYIFKHPWKKILIEDILRELREEKFTKSVSQILNDLGFKGIIKQIFIPNASSKAVEFRNPITYEFAQKNHLPELKLEIIRNSKK